MDEIAESAMWVLGAVVVAVFVCLGAKACYDDEHTYHRFKLSDGREVTCFRKCDESYGCTLSNCKDGVFDIQHVTNFSDLGEAK